MSEKIWYTDISNFINYENYILFFPTDYMTMDEKINSVMRFLLYFSLILYFFNQNTRVLYILVLCGLLSYVVSEMKLDNMASTKEKYVDETNNKSKSSRHRRCTKPSKLNPFMNVLMTDYKDNAERPRACDVENQKIKKSMKSKFEQDIYKNVDDVFDGNYSYRQFYTTPSTTIPNEKHLQNGCT